MSNAFLNPSTMPATRGYTHVVETTGPSRTVYIAGQLGMTPEGKFAGGQGDFKAQAAQCFENLKAALAAIEQSCDIAVNQVRSGLRAWILCEFYPDRREEAFDDAFRYGEFGGYDSVTTHPDYAAYLARRVGCAR